MNIFGLHPVVVNGTDEQKETLPAAAHRWPRKGLLRRHRADAGLNTLKLKTRAVRQG